ncbi:hypothetical protein SNEBB_007043 [Seison nebaliae]|nr:hypothetical protein SNEBB_007043 [Seison nebaliae]
MRRFTYKKLTRILIIIIIIVILKQISIDVLRPEKIVQLKLTDYHDNERKLLPSLNQQEKWEDLVNYNRLESLKKDRLRHGNGEQGKPFLLSNEQLANPLHESLKHYHGFEGIVSDALVYDRSLPDLRHPKCLRTKYFRTLPHTSVIITVRNELSSVLYRSVTSLINRASEHLREIIIVDDNSKPRIKFDELHQYAMSIQNSTDKIEVKFELLSEQNGLMKARMAGARVAKSEVLLFLDSHIECQHNYLPPLLHEIAKNYKMVACPFIDIIDGKTFAFREQDQGARGAFDWNMDYKRLPTKYGVGYVHSVPFESPVMAGGLFAITKRWFWELGGYDEELKVWGGEQYEISFKIWQCGGRMVDVPCSRIGHIYRIYGGHTSGGQFSLGRNLKRVVEVWMDEYKEYVYKRLPYLKHEDVGKNIEKMKIIRTQLECKSFDWYMKNVLYDLESYYPKIPKLPYASGFVQWKVNKSLCITGKNSILVLDDCLKGERWEFTWKQDMKRKHHDVCADTPFSEEGSPIKLFSCHGMKGNQFVQYSNITNTIKQMSIAKCFEGDSIGTVRVKSCDISSDKQKWFPSHHL